MDPVTLATVTTTLTLLSMECAKGLVSQAGKDVWTRIKSLFGWAKEPDVQELPTAIATRLNNDHALLNQVLKLLEQVKATDSSDPVIGPLVGTLTAQKAVVATKVEGGIKM